MSIQQDIKDRFFTVVKTVDSVKTWMEASAIPQKTDEVTFPAGFVTYGTATRNPGLVTNLHEGFDQPFAVSILAHPEKMDEISSDVQTAIQNDSQLPDLWLDYNLETTEELEVKEKEDMEMLVLIFLVKYRHQYGEPALP